MLGIKQGDKMKDGVEKEEDIDDEWKTVCTGELLPLSQDCPLTAGESLFVCVFTCKRLHACVTSPRVCLLHIVVARQKINASRFFFFSQAKQKQCLGLMVIPQEKKKITYK